MTSCSSQNIGQVVSEAKPFGLVRQCAHFSEGLVPAYVGNQAGFINSKGTIVIATKFQRACEFSEGLAAAAVDGKWGYIDRNGDFVIPPKFKAAHKFSQGLAAVMIRYEGSEPEWGYIDKTGEIVIDSNLKRYPKRYLSKGNEFSEGLAAVEFSARGSCPRPLWGYINQTGQVVIRPKFGRADQFSGGLASVDLGSGNFGQAGYVDRTGGITVAQSTRSSAEGLLLVQDEGYAWRFIDQSHHAVIPFQFEDAFPFSDGLAYAKSNGYWGFIDRTGKFVIPPQFEDDTRVNHKFSEGLSAVRIQGKIGYIDRTGAIAITPQFEEAEDFSDGLALVKLENGFYGYTNKQGIVVSGFQMF